MKKNERMKSDLLELLNADIITKEQYEKAEKYFTETKNDKLSTSGIFTAIGILLIAISIITFFAINWDDIPRALKMLVSFVPILITAVMFFFCIKNENKLMKIYTSIFAPISILATNSLISQVFHIQDEMYELILISMLMFLPLAFSLRTYISILLYGLGVVAYVCSIDSNLIIGVCLSIPLIVYNVINYIKNKDDKKNKMMWTINVVLISYLIFDQAIISSHSAMIYLLMIYLLTKGLFEKGSFLKSLLNIFGKLILLILCITPEINEWYLESSAGIDTIIITLIVGVLIYVFKIYKEPKEYFLILFVLAIQYLRLQPEYMCLVLNLIALAWGVYKIIMGNNNNSYKQVMAGTSIVLLLIFYRFLLSDLSFETKSVLFMISGIAFIIASRLIKKRMGGKQGE